MHRSLQPLALFLAVSAAVAGPLAGQGRRPSKAPKPGRVPDAFLGDLPAAQLLARERNVALLVCVIQDGEEANERFFHGVYESPEFVTLAGDAVVVAVNNGDHEQVVLKEEGADGEVTERSVCSWFETPSCLHHQRNWTSTYLAFNQDGDMRTPQLLVVEPDGKVRKRFVDEHKTAEIGRELASLRKAIGPGITRTQLVEVKRHRGAGETFARERHWPRAWAEWTALLAITEHGPFAEQARAGIEAALAAMRAAVAGALARMEAGEIVAGYEALRALTESYDDTPVEKELARAIKDAERNPAWRDALRAHKRALEADDLWREVERLLGLDQEARARRVAQRILQRYADTPAAEKVRKEFPDLLWRAALLSAGG